MGKIKKSMRGKRFRKADVKKAYVTLKTEIPNFF